MKFIDLNYKQSKTTDIARCLTTRYIAAPTNHTCENSGVLIEGDNMRIRRLTPRECWRLQGFPDEYFDKAKAAGISDSQLYKMAGNAVTVNVARAIGEKLKEIEDEEVHQYRSASCGSFNLGQG